jgi:hypothetical protein
MSESRHRDEAVTTFDTHTLAQVRLNGNGEDKIDTRTEF